MDILLNQWYSPIIGLSGLLLAILGLVLSIIFYRRSQRFKEPCWSIRTLILIEKNISTLSDLEVTYKDQLVETLSVSRVAVWNEGRETIHGMDIAQVNPLRISALDDVQILDASVIALNNPSSQFTVTDGNDNTSVLIKFDYIDQKQGGVLQLVHTGNKSADLILDGDIKGAKRPKRVQFPIYRDIFRGLPLSFLGRKRVYTSRLRNVSLLASICASLLLISYPVILLLPVQNHENGSDLIEALSNVLRIPSIIYFSILGIVMLYFTIRAYRSRPPLGLEIFEEDILQSEE